MCAWEFVLCMRVCPHLQPIVRQKRRILQEEVYGSRSGSELSGHRDEVHEAAFSRQSFNFSVFYAQKETDAFATYNHVFAFYLINIEMHCFSLMSINCQSSPPLPSPCEPHFFDEETCEISFKGGSLLSYI
jgi:hypothetical protein